MIAGVVSIGTNSTRALGADTQTARVLLARSTGTRIGEGLKEGGGLSPEAMRRTLDALRDHAAAVRELTDDVRAIATSALRRAGNGGEFAQRVQEITGARLEIISGEEEASRSYTGAVRGLVQSDPQAGARSFGVLDVGGGSSEYAVGDRSGPHRVTSCEIGAVRLTESLPALDGAHGAVTDASIGMARALAREALDPIAAFARPEELIFVGGSATTAAALVRGNREQFAYAPLTQGSVQACIDQLRSRDLEARKALPGMNPQRADILLGGLLLLDEVFALTGHASALASSNDLLLGTLLLRGETALHD